MNRNEQILQLWSRGTRIKNIAKHFGISHQRVVQILKEVGYEGATKRKERRAEIAKRLFAQGESFAAIAKEIGVSESYVPGLLRGAGLSYGSWLHTVAMDTNVANAARKLGNGNLSRGVCLAIEKAAKRYPQRKVEDEMV